MRATVRATMRAAVLHETGGPLVVEDVAVPSVGPAEVLVRVRACGLGLTLVWNRDGRRDARLPRIIGHEIAGVVVETGPGVDGFRPGDRVAVYYYLSCGECRRCQAGRENLCERRRGQVGRDIPGGLAEFVVLPAANLVPIPDGATDVAAAITTDAVVTALHVVRDRARVQPGETVLVIGGGGGVGVHVVQAARLAGAEVIVTDRTAAKLALATSAGARDVLAADTPDLADRLDRLTAGRGVDVVVDMVGQDATLELAADCLAPAAGRIVLVGSSDRAAKLPVSHETLRGEGAVLGSQYGTKRDLRDALDLVADGRIRPLVTRICSLDEADTVLREIESLTVAGRAAVVFES
jgi:propanol-preferring alcohol dehydrogenase